jgi:pimeloyl-ACP methyl ester carboxylesterase
MKTLVLAACAALALASGAMAQPRPPAAVFTDPPADAAHPARMEVLHIPTGGGLEVNGLALVASGAAPHPTVVLFHGIPGNEKNLDLAQAIRRAGWNVVTINYRGSWGSPGAFSFKGNLEDARAVLAYVRAPANAARLGVDTRRIVVVGHSMGGWVTSQTVAADPDVAGGVMISAADMSRFAAAPLPVRIGFATGNHETLTSTPEAMAEELAGISALSFAAAAPGLARKPLLVLTSDDGLAPPAEALVMDIKRRDGRVSIVHVATDHSWSTARIRLETEVLNWLAALPK